MTQRFTRDDGVTEVEVEYEVESYGSPNSDLPGHICDGGGEPPIIIITEAHDLNSGAKVVLTDEETTRMETWLVEHLDLGPSDDYEDDR